MERLTHKVKEPNHPCYVDMFWEEYETKNKHKAINKLGKLEDLEDQIGCPLEVKCRICTGRLVYLPNGKAYLIAGVRDSYFTIKIEDGFTETVDNKEYGISWWFKPDKSE